MKNTRSLVLLMSLFLALAGLMLGCEEKPAEPAFSNPLDPGNPDGGDPFAVEAGYIDGQVVVSWNLVDLDGITGYEVFHSLLPSSEFLLVAEVDKTVSAVFTKIFAPNVTNYYKVRAFDEDGNSSAISQIVAASLLPPPYLQIGDTNIVFTRNVVVTVTTALGDTAQIDTSGTFADPIIREITPGDTLAFDWDLGTADSVGVYKHFYLRVSTAGVWSETAHDSVKVSFDPVMLLSGNPATVPARHLDLMILGEGVHQMRFAPTAEALADSVWLPGSGTHSDYAISAEPIAQDVYGEFASDFGFSLFDTLTAVPDSLLEPGFTIEGGAEASSEYEFGIAAAVKATRMRFAESPAELAVTGWDAFATSSTYAHSACAGDPEKIVLGQFENDWFISPVIADTILWIQPQPLQIDFDPVESVLSATTATISGTAVPATCGPGLDRVEIDTGNGYTTATGLETWSIDWPIPTVAADTTVTLGALVIAGSDTAGAGIEVLIIAPVLP